MDFYCTDEQINNWFYGLKVFTDENNVGYKIISTNKFVLYKIKLKLVLKLKQAIVNGEIIDENKKFTNIIQKLVIEKGIQRISFIKLILLYNKFMNE